MGTFNMLFSMVKGLHSAIFSFYYFFQRWPKSNLILLEYTI